MAELQVLHVDDDPDYTDLTARMLRRVNPDLSLIAAHSVDDALDLVSADIDCVVSDYEMPEMNGIEFLEAVRERDPDLPFILVTGKGSEEIASEAISAGVTEYLQKGHSEDQFSILANRIENVTTSARAQRAARRSQQRFDRLAAVFPDIAFYIDEDGTYIDIIAGEESPLLAQEAEGIRGRRIADLFDPVTVERFETVIARVIADETAETIEYRLPVQAGNRWFEAEVVPLDTPLDGRAGVIWVARDITERKEREQELEAVHRRTEFALDVTDSYVFEFTHESEGVTRHGPFERLHGLSPESVQTSETFIDRAVHPADRDELERYERELREGEIEGAVDLEFRAHPGLVGERWLRQTTALREGEPERLIGLTTDITDQKRQEAELDAERRRYRTLTEGIPDVVYRADPETLDPLFVNDSIEDVFGYPPDEWLADPSLWRQSIHPDDKPRVLDRFGTLLERSSPDGGEIEYRIHTRDGETRWLVDRFRVERDDEGNAVSVLGIERDITTRKRFEEELEEKSRAMDEAPIGIVMIDPAGPDNRIVYANRSVQRITGYDESELLGNSWRVFEGDETEMEPVTRLQDAIESRSSATVEIQHARRDGSPFWNRMTIAPVSDGTHVVSFVGFLQDVTASRERRQRIQHERERFEVIMNASPDVVIVYDADGRYRDVLTGQEQLLADEADTLIDSTLEERLPPEPARVIREGIERTLETQQVQRVMYDLVIEHETYSFEARLAPLSALEEDLVVLMARDVTERVRRERELHRQNERLEEFARILSHDLRNPLNVADGRLELAREDGDQKHFAAIERSHRRIEELIEDLLTWTRSGEAVDAGDPCSVESVVEDAWLHVDTGNATLHTDVDLVVRGEAGRLTQLFENLIRNAIEHGGDDVSVTVREIGDGEGFYLEDDGPGIPESDRDRVFESGYSTRSSGTGFGLAIVEEIVEAHNWEIRITDGASGGARFEIIDVDVVP